MQDNSIPRNPHRRTLRLWLLTQTACKLQLHSDRRWHQRVLPDTGNNRHKRVCVFGEKGFVHWRFESWERNLPDSGYEGGDLNYGDQDVIAQGGLTDAVFEWLDDESKVHPTHLKQSLAEFNLLLGIYYSGLTNTVVELPFDPPDGMIDMFRERL